MKRKTGFVIFIGYVKEHLAPAALFAAFAVIFAVIFSLYNLPVEAVLYAAGLCALLGAVCLVAGFIRYCKRHGEMLRILENVQILSGDLEGGKTLAEEDLTAMVKKLKRLLDESETARRDDAKESMDYYTTWVHQIKTPISTMKMMLEGEDSEESRSLLSELFRIEQYAEMALSYIRLGDDSSDYVFKEYDLDGIIRDSVRKYAPQFIRKKIGLNYGGTDVKVLTDEKWLRFVIEQVLSNSIKYTREGSVTITVTPEKVLKIADTGIGIAPEDVPRIFEKGFTGYNGRSDKKSTGLGLYLCKTACSRLSHKISAESEPGKGTVISIDLSSEKAIMD
jgi:signal transduction histidine kinase